MHHFESTKNRDTAVMSGMLKNVCSVGGIGYRKPPVIGQWYRGDRSSSAGHLLLFVVAARRHMSSTVADLNAASSKMRSGMARCPTQSFWPTRSPRLRSEEHTSELQSLMRLSYAVLCLKKKNNTTTNKK